MVGWDADGLPWVVGVPCQPAAAALAAAAPIATTTTATSDRLGTRPLRQCSGSRKLQQKHLHGGSMNTYRHFSKESLKEVIYDSEKCSNRNL